MRSDSLDQLFRYGIYCIDCVTNKIKHGGYQQKFSVIFDTTDVSFSNLDKNLFKFATSYSHVVQEYYPERLHTAYMVGLSWKAKPLYWAIQKLLATKTKAKIVIVSKDLHELKRDFNQDELLTDYGGNIDIEGDRYSSRDMWSLEPSQPE